MHERAGQKVYRIAPEPTHVCEMGAHRSRLRGNLGFSRVTSRNNDAAGGEWLAYDIERSAMPSAVSNRVNTLLAIVQRPKLISWLCADVLAAF